MRIPGQGFGIILVCLVAGVVPPRPVDGGKQLTHETNSYAWRSEVLGHEVAAANTAVSVAGTAKEAASEADKAAAAAATANGDPASIVALVQQQADAAIAARDEIKAIAERAIKAAEDSARATSEAVVAKLKAEAAAYYKSREGKLAALAIIPASPKADAAQAAAQPYMSAALDTQNMVLQYNQKANDLVNKAFSEQSFGRTLATKANQVQAAGDVIMANRLMIQAHGAMVQSQLDETQAKSIYALAREFNQVIPMYQGAGHQAAVAVMAGLQMNHTHSELSQDKIELSLEKTRKALEKLSASHDLSTPSEKRGLRGKK